MTWARRVVQVIDRSPQRTAFTKWNVNDWLGVVLPPVTLSRIMSQLAGAGCIVPIGGGGKHPRMYARVPGVPAPADQRGKSVNTQEALAKGRSLRLRASRGFVRGRA